MNVRDPIYKKDSDTEQYMMSFLLKRNCVITNDTNKMLYEIFGTLKIVG